MSSLVFTAIVFLVVGFIAGGVFQYNVQCEENSDLVQDDYEYIRSKREQRLSQKNC